MTQQNVTFLKTTSLNILYSTPELIDTRVYSDRIELIYKRQYMVSVGQRLPDPEIYAEVYSRTDGSMRIVNGKYIPAKSEYYLLDEYNK